MKYADYKVVEGSSPEAIAGHVRLALADGWQLVGGVSVLHAPENANQLNPYLYFQALTKGRKRA